MILAAGGLAVVYLATKHLYGQRRATGITYYLNGRKVFAPYGANGKPDYSRMRPVN